MFESFVFQFVFMFIEILVFFMVLLLFMVMCFCDEFDNVIVVGFGNFVNVCCLVQVYYLCLVGNIEYKFDVMVDVDDCCVLVFE